MQLEFSVDEYPIPVFPKLTWILDEGFLILTTFFADGLLFIRQSEDAANSIDEAIRAILNIDVGRFETQREPIRRGTYARWVVRLMKGNESILEIPTLEALNASD